MAVCSEVLRSEGKSYPRTCAVHGLQSCPTFDPAPVCNQVLILQKKDYTRTCAVHRERACPNPVSSNPEQYDYVQRYIAAKGQTEREFIVEEMIKDDSVHLHRILDELGRLRYTR